ncbi:unnamed protein product [Blepharisma stoltei]|uniref:Tetratricopeptide repeat protein n=1 Tax=Blepharisma stoltei TaxID=1481888 RepID=A0AAU9JA34_9CILI|nr:unnamed protein product [Blepharisma stoltei]
MCLQHFTSNKASISLIINENCESLKRFENANKPIRLLNFHISTASNDLNNKSKETESALSFIDTIRNKTAEILSRPNNPELEIDFRTTCSAIQAHSSLYDPPLMQAYQDYLKAYQLKTSLYNLKWDSNGTKLIIYNTETETQEEINTLQTPERLDSYTCITQLPNGKLFCFGNCPASGITVLIDVDGGVEVLPSGTPCSGSSCIYFNNSVYCFGGSNEDDSALISIRFDLDQNRWIKLTPMPKADYWCNSIIFNGNILISGHWNKNLWLYSIDIDSFSTIPYEFKYNERKILINAERLYLIECRGSIYESEIGSYSNWRRIAESKFNFNQVFCSYNKGGIYISNISILDEEYYYYFFNLDQKIIIDIAYYGRHAALRRVGKKIEVIKSNVQNFKLDSNYLDERSLKDNALKTLGEKFAKIEFYDKQITLDPDSATFYNKKCNAFYNWERYLEAIECFDEAIKPKDANYYNKKGHAFCNWERYLEAIECYDGAIKLDPKDASFYDNKGDAFYNLERYLEAIECFDEAIKLDPKNAIYYKNKGDAFYNLKRYREAIECFDEAVKLDPKNAIYYKNKGDAFYNLERYREAIKPKNLFFSKCIMI